MTFGTKMQTKKSIDKKNLNKLNELINNPDKLVRYCRNWRYFYVFMSFVLIVEVLVVATALLGLTEMTPMHMGVIAGLPFTVILMIYSAVVYSHYLIFMLIRKTVSNTKHWKHQ